MSWVNESVFYHIYPLGFCDAPKKNEHQAPVMRIKKVEEWIPHLKSMGISAVYFGPVFASSSHGYDTSDYYQLDPRLGDNAAFAEVCSSLHQNGIRVVLDGVFNHVGRDFWAFQDVCKNKESSPYCGWFQNLNFGGNSPCGDPFWYEGWQGHYALVKLNLRNPDVVQHLLDAVGSWIDQFEIDGLRLDAADCVDMDFFRRLRGYCKGRNPDFWLMGEIIHGDYNRWANSEMLDSVTNYECHKGLYSSHNDKNYFEIGYSLNRQSGNGGIYKNLCLYNFTDNHDVNRLASFLKNHAHLRNVYTLLYTMPGVPSIYYGSEWGIAGARDKYSDDALRPCLTLGEIPNADETLPAFLGTLAQLRQRLSALKYGEYEQVMLKNEQFIFCRTHGAQQVYVALNLADHAEYVEFRVKHSPLVDLFSGTSFETNDGNLKLELPALSARILVAREDWFELTAVPEPQPVSIQQPVAAPERKSVEAVPQDAAVEAVTPGHYRHFKGGEYQVIGIAKHSETLEEMVVYRALYGGEGLWVRPLSMFLEVVEKDGKPCKRFTRIND